MEAIVRLRPDYFYQHLRVRLGAECSWVPFVLHPRVYFELRTKILWLRQYAGTCAIQSWFQTLLQALCTLGTSLVLCVTLIKCIFFPFSPCSTLWFSRVANTIEREMSFSYIFTVFSTVIPLFWSRLQLLTSRCYWCLGSLSNWEVSNLSDGKLSLGLCGPWNLIASLWVLQRDDTMWTHVVIGTYWVTHKVFSSAVP